MAARDLRHVARAALTEATLTADHALEAERVLRHRTAATRELLVTLA